MSAGEEWACMQVGVCNMCPHTPTGESVVYFLFLIAIHSFFHSSIQQILRTYCIMLVATPAMEPLLSDTFNKSCHKAVKGHMPMEVHLPQYPTGPGPHFPSSQPPLLSLPLRGAFWGTLPAPGSRQAPYAFISVRGHRKPGYQEPESSEMSATEATNY